MSIPMFSEKRRERRKKLTGLLPGKLCIAGREQFVNCRPMDVSEKGIGILSTDLLSEGMALELRTPTLTIQLLVAWGQPDFSKTNSFRYGLICKDESVDMEKIFEAAGCLVSS